MPEAFDSDAFDPAGFDSEAFEFGAGASAGIVVQSRQQGYMRAVGGTATTYNGDLIAAMAADLGDDVGCFNERLTRWLQFKLGSSSTRISALMAEAAADRGVNRWQEIQNPTAIGT